MIMDMNMKRDMKYLVMAACAAMAMMSAVSCDDADELPPMNDGYATEFILPDPVDLTAADREVIHELQDEYNADIASN